MYCIFDNEKRGEKEEEEKTLYDKKYTEGYNL